MREAERMIEALKRVLKSKGVTYGDLARALKVSEPTVKRVFSERSFTLYRLEQICETVGISLGQLAKLADSSSSAEAVVLTEGQEKALASDPRLFAFFHLLANGQSPEQIARGYRVSEPEKLKFLSRLSRLGLIELLPGKGVRLLFNRHFRWSASGPLMNLYQKPIRDEFFCSAFEKDHELLRLVLGRLSPQSFAQLRKKFHKLLLEFDELNEMDRDLPKGEAEDMAILIAYRPWAFSKIRALGNLPKRD
jgi:transcriptional regulator with XRE-family HTH domain